MATPAHWRSTSQAVHLTPFVCMLKDAADESGTSHNFTAAMEAAMQQGAMDPAAARGKSEGQLAKGHASALNLV